MIMLTPFDLFTLCSSLAKQPNRKTPFFACLMFIVWYSTLLYAFLVPILYDFPFLISLFEEFPFYTPFSYFLCPFIIIMMIIERSFCTSCWLTLYNVYSVPGYMSCAQQKWNKVHVSWLSLGNWSTLLFLSFLFHFQLNPTQKLNIVIDILSLSYLILFVPFFCLLILPI